MLANTDSSFGETRHKHFAKLPGKQTQRRKDTFDKEVANRNIDSVFLSLGISHLNENTNSDLTATDDPNKRTEGPLYVVSASGAKRHPRSTCFVELNDQRTLDTVPLALQQLADCILPILDKTQEICTYHTLILHGNTYRCCPNYKNSPWYDWARVKQQDGSIRTMRLLLFFIQPQTYEIPLIYQGHCNLGQYNTFVLGQYLDDLENTYKTHVESEMLYSAQLDDSVQITSVDNIVCPAAVYHDYDFEDATTLTGIRRTEYYGLIHSRSSWSSIFLDRAKSDAMLSS
jgi:hypothetical protein